MLYIIIIYSVWYSIKKELNKNSLLVEPCSISWHYIMKQLEYSTKDHIVMYTILLNLKQFFSLVS